MPAKGRYVPALIVFAYFLSGMTALAYEVLWAKMLGLIFGASIFGVVITIAAFMAGLGCGSSAGFYLQRRIRRPLLVFAAIEIAIGFFAFNLPALLALADSELLAWGEGFVFAGWFGLQALVFFAVLFLPAFAMGFGFPMILRVLQNSPIGLSTIYAINTLGGVFGALLPLLLLPVFGWTVADRLVALGSFSIGGLALALAWKNDAGEGAGEYSAANRIHWPSALAYAVIGAASLMLQVAWTRIYGMLLLRTEYVMAIILASFLVGIGLGSYLARWMRQGFWLLVLPLLAACFSVVTLWALPWLAQWAETARFDSLLGAMLSQSAMIVLMTLPVTLAFGAWLPVLTREYGDDHSHGAVYYATNSLGAAVGALLAGLLITPWLGSAAVVWLAVTMILLASLVWVHRPGYLVLAATLVVLAVPVASLPPVNRLLPVSQAGSRDLAVYEDALGITHVVEQADGTRLLLADLHRMDASTEPTAVAVQKNQARLPLLLAARPRKVLFLGLGTGITAAGSLPWDVAERTAVELSAGAIAAATEAFREVNGAVVERLQVVRDDARRFLKLDDGRYDVIIGDLFHPDLIGRSALLSLQQFQRAREHLSENGVFVQWLALNQFDVYSLRVVLQTFRQAFPAAVMFMDGFRLALVGSKSGDIAFAPAVWRHLAGDQAEAMSGGEGGWTWLGRYFGRIGDQQVPVQDEWAPVIEFSLPAARYGQRVKLEEVSWFLLRQRPEPQQAARELGVARADYAALEQAYMATSFIFSSWLAGFAGDAPRSEQFLRMAYQANPHDRWVAFSVADRLFDNLDRLVAAGQDRRELLQRVLQIRPDHLASLKALWHLERAAGNTTAAADYLRRIRRLSPLDKMARENLPG